MTVIFVIHSAPNKVLFLASGDTQVVLVGLALGWTIACSGSNRTCSRNFPQFELVVVKVLLDCLLNSVTLANRAHGVANIYRIGELCGLDEAAAWSENGRDPAAALGRELKCFGVSRTRLLLDIHRVLEIGTASSNVDVNTRPEDLVDTGDGGLYAGRNA